MNKSTVRIRQPRIAILLLIFLVVMGGWMRFETVTLTEVRAPLGPDALKYVSYAINLRTLGVYAHATPTQEGDAYRVAPDALVTPGYPLFLSLFIDRGLDDSGYYRIQLTQALLSTLTIILTFLVFLRLGEKVALGASALTALSPHLINMNVYLLTESLFTFFLLLSFTLLILAYERRSTGLFLFTGVALGAASLTRPYLQGYVILLLIFLATTHTARRRDGAALLLGFLCLLAPWLIRNFLVLGALSDPTLTNSTLHHGIYPGMMFDQRPETLGFPYRFDPDSAALGRSIADWWTILESRMAAHPWLYLQWFLFGKAATVMQWSILSGMGDAWVYEVSRSPYFELPFFAYTHALMRHIHNPIVVLAVCASLLAWTRHTGLKDSSAGLYTLRILSLLLLYFLVAHSIGAPFPRYSIPLRPVIYGLAAYALFAFLARLRYLYPVTKTSA